MQGPVDKFSLPARNKEIKMEQAFTLSPRVPKTGVGKSGATTGGIHTRFTSLGGTTNPSLLTGNPKEEKLINT